MKAKKGLIIIYEDEYLLAMNKPGRILAVPAADVPLCETALGLAQKQFADADFTPYVLHRLDSNTSGVLLFGKREKDRRALENIFGQPETQKKYLALVIGAPRGNTIRIPLQARESRQKIPARTDYKIIKIFKAPRRGPLCSLVEAEIKTGRKHQIRQHFALIGHPVVMDSRYGDQRFNRKFRLCFRLGRQFLHAASFEFLHPFAKKHVRIFAPLAPDLQLTLKRLNFEQ